MTSPLTVMQEIDYTRKRVTCFVEESNCCINQLLFLIQKFLRYGSDSRFVATAITVQ